MPDVKSLIGRQISEAADRFQRTVQAVPADKATWKPLDAGRTVLDQLVEVGGWNGFAAQILRARAVPPFSPDIVEEMRRQYDTMEKATRLFTEGTESLIAAVKEFPDERLDETIDLPFGGGMRRTFAELMLMPYWNMVYHEGQVNYVQTLYGDTQMY